MAGYVLGGARQQERHGIQVITRKETCQRLAVDRKRLLDLLKASGETGRFMWMMPAWQAAWLHRWSHYHFTNGRRLLSRAYWHLNLLLTGADISPITNIGPGVLFTSPFAVVLVGHFGTNVTICGHVAVGGGMAREDIGAGLGLPVVGDDVVLHFNALVLGPVRIGNGAQVGARCLVTRDIPAGGVVASYEPRERQCSGVK